MTSQIETAVYEAAHHTAILVDRSQLGMLKFTGQSRLDLIHRMSTQDVLNLEPGQGTATILLTDIGRIIDRLILYPTTNTVYALTGENNADNIARYLMRFVFFNDDFHIEDISQETAIWGVYGPQAQPMLAAAGFPQVDLPLHHWRQAEIAGTTAYLHRTDPLVGDGYFVMGQTADKKTLRHHLLSTGLVAADASDYDFLRIESGWPRLGRELTLEYIPLEANLWDDVSFSKGCYIGQEIIARMESRGRLAKRLVRLQPTTPLEPGADLQTNGKKAGTITSTATGPSGPIALGYVKTAVLEEKNSLTSSDVSVTILDEPAL